MKLFTPKWMKRAEETAKLTDQQKLFKAAMESDYYDVIHEAVSRLSDNCLLLRFIKEIKEKRSPVGLLELAIDRVSDQELLLEIAEYFHFKFGTADWHYGLALRAMHKVYDIKVLKKYKTQCTEKRGPNELESFIEIYAEDMLKLASELPGDPESQRTYINSLQFPNEVRGCCMLIETLRPYAEDVKIVVSKEGLYFDYTFNNTLSNIIGEIPNDHKRARKRWKKAAKKLIALSAEQPEILYPVWDKLGTAINGAEAVVRDRKKIGKKNVGDMYEPTIVDVYEYFVKKTPMGLIFPANRVK